MLSGASIRAKNSSASSLVGKAGIHASISFPPSPPVFPFLCTGFDPSGVADDVEPILGQAEEEEGGEKEEEEEEGIPRFISNSVKH